MAVWTTPSISVYTQIVQDLEGPTMLKMEPLFILSVDWMFFFWDTNTNFLDLSNAASNAPCLGT